MATVYTCVSVPKFYDWLQEKLAVKYNAALEGLRKRFYALLVLLEEVVSCAVELREATAAQHLLDNLMCGTYRHIAGGIIQEYPKVLDAEYYESFVKTIQERVELLYANFHPLTHLSFTGDALNRRAESLCTSISRAFLNIPNVIIDIQRRAELATPLLREISVPLQALKYPVLALSEQLTQVKAHDHSRADFELALKRLQQLPNPTADRRFFQQLGQDVKRVAEVQANLNSLLEPAVHMSHVIKKRGKKGREEEADENPQLLKFVNLLLKPDFIATYLPILVNLEDLVKAVHHLENRICSDLSQRHALALGLDNFSPIHGEELRVICETQKTLLKHMEDLQHSPELKEELKRLQGEPQSEHAVPFSDLQEVCEKLRMYHASLILYHKASDAFQILRYKVAKHCLEEFNERVELLWEDS